MSEYTIKTTKTADFKDRDSFELITCEIYRNNIRKMLVEKISEVQGISPKRAKKIVGKILPDNNFYFFKANLRDIERKKSEVLEIKKIIYDILTDSKPFMCETPNMLKPPLRDFQFINSFFDFYNEKINFILTFITEYKKEFEEYIFDNIFNTAPPSKISKIDDLQKQLND